MEVMRGAAAVAAFLILAACSTSSGLSATETRSGFDGARVVHIAPHGAACVDMPCISIGGEWNSKRPQSALVIASLAGPEFAGLRALEFNIDGRMTSYPAAPGLSEFTAPTPPLRMSTHTFVVPMADLRAIADARRAWVRVSSTRGWSEQAIVDGDTDSKALHALRRFLAQVDSGAK